MSTAPLPAVPLTGAHLDAPPSMAATADDIRETVALHAAATMLPPTASLPHRETVRSRWHAALTVIPAVAGHPQWALAYLPGVHQGDNDAYAVHLPTGRVYGGDCDQTSQRSGENTHQWLTRLHDGLDTVLADYRPRHIRHPEHG